jgi:hypothetical protein
MYAFRAWIDERGSNVDRLPRHHRHLKLWDLNRKDGRNVVRTIRRRRPLYVAVFLGANYRRLHIGRTPSRWV